MIINSYGLHEIGGVSFLVQATGVVNLISPDLGNPFTLKFPLRGITCPHDIHLDQASDEQPEWLQDPLAQALLPLPGARVFVLRDPHDRYLRICEHLAKLSSPTEVTFQPIWWKSSFSGRRRYMATNVGPIIWSGVENRHLANVVEHMDMARTFHRTLVILTRDEIPVFGQMERIESGLTRTPEEDLQAIGGGALRRWMADGQGSHRVPG